MMKAIFKVILGDKQKTKFMQACDVFESSKVLGEFDDDGGLIEAIIEFKEGEEVSLERAGKAINTLKLAFEQEGSKIVTLIHLSHIMKGNSIIPNDETIAPYVNKKVRMVSNGKKFGMLHDLLKGIGLKVTTNEHMYIQTAE